MNNPFITLCRTSAGKNIDANFAKTLEALLFLNSKKVGDIINETYQTEILASVDSKTVGSQWFQEKIKNKTAEKIERQRDYDDYENNSFSLRTIQSSLSLKYRKHDQYDREDYTISESIHIGNFLINKLSENFRRMYSFYKNGGKVPKELGSSIESLKEQQNNIYKCLDIVAPHVTFDNHHRTFNNLFFGKTRHCSEAQAFFYLSMHEHLLPQNESIHKKFFSEKFNTEDINPSMIKDVVLLNYPTNKSKFIKDIISKLPDDFFIDMSVYLTAKTKANSSFMTDLFLHCVNKNISLPKEQKAIILKNLLDTHGYWAKMPIEMAKPIADEIKDYISDISLKFIDSKIIFPGLIHKICSVDIALNLVENLNDEDLFYFSLINKMEPQQEATLYSKYDFSNQETLLNIAKKISSHSSNSKKSHMNSFISIVGDSLENESISNILSLDFSFMEVIEPLYMTRRIEEELGPSKNENPLNYSKKLKI